MQTFEEIEIWLPCPDFEEFYLISNYGLIKSLYTHKIKKNAINNKGYVQTSLWKNGKNHSKTIHRLVALAFIPNPNNYPEINHLDMARSNNYVKNLEWCTASMNGLHSYENNPNRILAHKGKFGKDNHSSKAVIQYDLQLNFMREWSSIADVHRELGFKISAISKCCLGGIETSRGFIWRFKENNKIPLKKKTQRNCKKVLQYDLQMNFIREWDSIKLICETFGYSKGNISSACRGIKFHPNAYGFIWKYK